MVASCSLVLLFVAAFYGGVIWLVYRSLARNREKKKEAAQMREAADREFKERNPEAWERQKCLEREELRRRQIGGAARIGWRILQMYLRK